ncbi:flagellar protein FliT [Vibrio ruber]|uniref:Flagellar protein FliT n=1 Tax=Vibrio ruber (strain DSM 16370 / JCM 11486 / BCRC 17186 / CECT 7878 / LMG 23124 / VR1) TaxID=1123498 RepID=A0A1R4LE63_VIBR1|nr:flagellar protein FliT [Vibrio ruber]WNJ94632.1 flagellar protein FliT [Vibrio ruber]SJN54861.1 Flagellar protein FliT [Vibrio ruber DSM 16370]
MDELLNQLSDIDHKIGEQLQEEEINTEVIHQLVDKRDQILQVLVQEASENQQFSRSEPWRRAIERTQRLVEEMQLKTSGIGHSLKKYRYGNKSVQQYKKFL